MPTEAKDIDLPPLTQEDIKRIKDPLSVALAKFRSAKIKLQMEEQAGVCLGARHAAEGELHRAFVALEEALNETELQGEPLKEAQRAVADFREQHPQRN